MENSLENKPYFRSSYKSLFERFIILKKTAGIKHIRYDFLLLLDNYLFEKKGSYGIITEESLADYCSKWLNESDNRFHSRLSYARSFLTFIKGYDIDTYIPRLPRKSKTNFKPRIYTTEEIISIFNELDKIRPKRFLANSNAFSIPIIIRTLYSTGARLNEVLSLKTTSVSFENATLTFFETKNGKDRIIPISQSLKEELFRYNNYMKKAYSSSRKSEYFFPNLRGDKINKKAPEEYFTECLNKIKINDVNNCRLHDLRHTFAVHSFKQMLDNNIAIYNSLPLLSTYLGHTEFRFTEHYLRIVEENFPGIISKMDRFVYETLKYSKL